MDWLALIPTLISAASAIKTIVDVANSNADVVSKIQQAMPTLADALEKYGGDFFPKAKPELRIAAAAMTAFDPDVTKWLQGSMNALLNPSPNLKVDGSYGPKTKAAVERLQEQLGLSVDGWNGNLTQAAIMAALAKFPTIGSKSNTLT